MSILSDHKITLCTYMQTCPYTDCTKHATIPNLSSLKS